MRFSTNKNDQTFGIAKPTGSAKASGLKLLDNQYYQDEPFQEDCVMSAMDENQLMIPGSNLGGMQQFTAINQQIMQITQPSMPQPN